MSTMILHKDYEGKKKGDTVSVPFGKGRDMLKAGIASYPPPAAPTPAKVAVNAKQEIEVLREKFEAVVKSINEKHRAEIEKLKADARIANDEAKEAFEMADKATKENADLKQRVAELEKVPSQPPKNGLKENAK